MGKTAFQLAQELSGRFTGRVYFVWLVTRQDGQENCHVLVGNENAIARLRDRLAYTTGRVLAEYQYGLLRT